jgi:hypothetical protein
MASTYYVTPDLAHEGNLIKLKYDLGWLGFLIWIVFSTLFWIVLYYFHDGGFTFKNTESPQNVKEFLFSLFFNQLNDKNDLTTTNVGRVVESFYNLTMSFYGYFFIRSFSFAKLYATIDNCIVGFYDRIKIKDGLVSPNEHFVDLKTISLVGFPVSEWVGLYTLYWDKQIENYWYPILNYLLSICIVLCFVRVMYKQITNQMR